jgi:hypothetical protein
MPTWPLRGPLNVALQDAEVVRENVVYAQYQQFVTRGSHRMAHSDDAVGGFSAMSIAAIAEHDLDSEIKID